eukprot:9050086-Pyramimonas_sp.AAC.1
MTRRSRARRRRAWVMLSASSSAARRGPAWQMAANGRAGGAAAAVPSGRPRSCRGGDQFLLPTRPKFCASFSS